MGVVSNYKFTEGKKFKLSLSLVSSFFIYFFLVFFQPFGVNNYDPNENITWELVVQLSSLIPVVFLTIYLNERIIRPIFIKKSNLKFVISWFIWEFVLVGTNVFLMYNYLGGFHDFSLSSYIFHVFEVSSILLFPFIGTLIYFRMHKIKKEYKNVLTLPKEKDIYNYEKDNELVLFSGEYKKDQIALQINSIVVIESEDNYAGLNYLEDNQLKKYLIRSTLSNMMKLITSKMIVRCNRSKIVNLNQLLSYKIVSNKLFLKLNYFEKEILVSKSNFSKVMNLIQNHLHMD